MHRKRCAADLPKTRRQTEVIRMQVRDCRIAHFGNVVSDRCYAVDESLPRLFVIPTDVDEASPSSSASA